MSIIHTFIYKDQAYDIKVNNKVRKAINDYELKAAKLNISDEAIKALSKMDLGAINNDKHNLNALLPLLPYVDEFASIGNDPFDTVYIILNTLYGMSKDNYEELLNEIEEKEGSEALCSLINKINKEVFMEVEKLNNLLKE